MLRRDVLRLAAFSAAASALELPSIALPVRHPIIDAHIHLFDPTRPGGVPWPTKDDAALYRPALPARYAALASPFGVTGAIAIEASPLASDNQWLLDVAAKHPIIVGIIGDLIPGSPSYLADLDRLHRNQLFLGIRYGNLWDRDLAIDLKKPRFVDGLKALAQAGMVLDSANPDPSLIHAILDVAEQVPGLRIVIDHLPHSPVPTEPIAHDRYWSDLRTLAQHPGVFVKLSEIPVLANGKLIKDPHFYQPSLDAIWDLFGEDRILFGSDWPNSDHVAPFADTLAIVRGYIAQKRPEAQEKYFWKNSIAAYKWHRRRPDQPAL
jgi:predicted TIM-barrel fold metal-dependent hydrolase